MWTGVVTNHVPQMPGGCLLCYYRYVVSDADTPINEANLDVTPIGGSRCTRASSSGHANSFLWTGGNKDDINEASSAIQGAPISDLSSPVVSGDIFGGQDDNADTSALPPSAARLSPTGRGSQAPRRFSGSYSGRGDALAVAGAATAPVGSGHWDDRRSRANSRTGGLGGVASGGGGSIWMEAAAAAAAADAVDRHSAPESGTPGVGVRPARRGAVVSGGESVTPVVGAGIPGSGRSTALFSPREGGGDIGRPRNASTGRRAWRSSAPSADDVWSVSSTSTLEHSAAGEVFSRVSGDVGGRSRQPSAMALAAEEAAAITAAKGHPEAKRVEERTLAAQSMVERALETLEHRLKPLVERRQSPVASDAQGSSRGLPSAYRSPRDSRPPFAARSEGEEQGHRWVAVVPTGGAAAIPAAPLAGAAALLMERACTRRQELLGSAYALRQRAISLAVAEASASGVEGEDPGSPLSQSFLAGDSIASPPLDARWSRGANMSSQDVRGGGRGFPRGQANTDGGAFRVITVEQNAGVPGLSTCGDFDKILGEDAPGRAGGSTGSFGASLATKVYEDREQKVLSGSWLNDRGSSLTNSSIMVERSTFGVDLLASQGGRLEWASRGSHRGGSLTRGVVTDSIPDSWRVLFREVSAAEERCRGLVADWDAAGLAFRDACEDDDLGVIGGG